MQSQSITPTTEAFRLAVAGSPVACLDYPTPAVTGSLEALVVFMDRHRARVETYAQLAGLPLATAADSIRLAAEKLGEAREKAAERWSEMCAAMQGDLAGLYQAAHSDRKVLAFAETACLTPHEAAMVLAKIHLTRSHVDTASANHGRLQDTAAA